MVVAALFSYYAPSNRGFLRDKDADKVPIDSFHIYDDDFQQQQLASSTSTRRQSLTTLRRKPLRAMAVLTSIASDFDVISDWVFFSQTFSQDKKYREQHAENPQEGELPYLIPPSLLTSVLACCILGSITYLVLATEGRIIAPFMKRFGVDKISMGFVLFLSVLVEDIPQVVLTFLVEDYYEEDQYLSEWAVMNLCASLYDTAIKLAESFDQRHDVVETGVWCKKSIIGHNGTITDLLILPDDHTMPPPNNPRAVSEPALPTRSSYFKTHSTTSTTAASKSGPATTLPSSNRSKFDTSMSLSDFRNAPFRRTSTKPLLVEAFFPEEESLASRIHFLTASMDRTLKLWDISSYTDANLSTSGTYHENQCIDMFQDNESRGFTCLAWVGSQKQTSCKEDAGNDKSTRCSFFLAGCNNGAAKLWDLSGVCHAIFMRDDVNANNRVASIDASMFRDCHIFVCGHENGIIRIWNTWAGHCLGEFVAHERRITSVSFLQDGQQFVSASTDSTIKLWDTSNHVIAQEPSSATESLVSTQGQDNSDSSIQHTQENNQPLQPSTQGQDNSDSSIQLTQENNHPRQPSTGSHVPDCRSKATQEFLGHAGAVLSLVVVDDKSALLTGSLDGTARLWSIASGLCLRIFRGHSDSVTSVQAIDRVTFLTGSKDTTIKAWDALSGQCLRTYEGHTSIVTGLTVVSSSPDETEKASTFISSSSDRSIKCWVLTSVSYKDPVAALEHILDFHENACQCFDPKAVSRDNSALAKTAYGDNSAMTTRPKSHFAPDLDHPYYQEAP